MYIPRFHAFSSFDDVPDGFCCYPACMAEVHHNQMGSAWS